MDIKVTQQTSDYFKDSYSQSLKENKISKSAYVLKTQLKDSNMNEPLTIIISEDSVGNISKSNRKRSGWKYSAPHKMEYDKTVKIKDKEYKFKGLEENPNPENNNIYFENSDGLMIRMTTEWNQSALDDIFDSYKKVNRKKRTMKP